MRMLVPLLALMGALAISNGALSDPFDMSIDRPDGKPVDTGSKDRPAPVIVPKIDLAPLQKPRYLLPFQSLKLNGEFATKTWTIYLTPAQAAAARTLNYGYRNAIVVAPETSSLSVYVNDTLIADEPVQSPNGISERSYKLPTGLLRPGINKLSFRGIQQHRTDCSVQSTYELWSEIIPERTFLTLDPDAIQVLTTLDDVKAIGVDKMGRTHFRVVTPKLQQPNQTDALMRLSQGLALLGRMPNQSFTIATSIGPEAGPGELTVAVGIAADLRPLMPALPKSADNGSFTGFVEQTQGGKSVLVFSGPTWQTVEAAIENMVSPLERPEDRQRDVLWTQAWNGSDTPYLRARSNLTFAKLGVPTTEFSGRLFRTGFEIGVPADFYANAYGEATILLDAAYSDEILPGSHIDIYVNGNIASTVPITSTNGGLFRHLPIRVTMRHFKPGANRIEVEAVLKAKPDIACVPGAAASGGPRFAIFNTSEFRIPDFARIAQSPSLSAVAGTGFPYGRGSTDVALFMDRVDSQTLSTTAMFLGKLAIAAGRPLKAMVETSTSRIGDRNAIFVGAISQIPTLALNRVYISEASRTAWGNQGADVAAGLDNKEAFEEWKARVRSGTWQGQITAVQEWLKDTFDISLGSLQFLPAAETDILPDNSSTFLAAQGLSPEGTGTWMVLAAPTGNELQQGMSFLSDEKSWQDMSGHVLFYDKAEKTVKSVAAVRSYLIATQPFSLFNYRLIAANWLSTNILSYAVLFAGASVLLGLATSALLNSFGRGK
ncbi:cellulose biosynthesis cyclic di-GMP-binding regulatory protein BcsB [Rhizobium sp. KVB221]|uniref:Cyclic di-GMP-binding protein n=1 Tax=Rhizobium setariae TaxID=2801340 RepID=A0A937CKH7_9HYPH|nr:cellulose biosynthesis cyclic di-GMP-binding regulatory protein BcsB [Rhizobium setariae]MBL0372155.1 cellulose biosynthesis cyclic di-GMP-binding regulatory protein BcsB [Rhizobium setariae]